MYNWLIQHQALAWGVAGALAIILIAGLLATALMIARIRADYFAFDTRPVSRWLNTSPNISTLLNVAKNLLGCLLLLGGVATMMFPVPAAVTLLVGVLLIDFPGKYGLERWLMARAPMRQLFNWLRHRAGNLPLRIRPRSLDA